MEQGNFVPDSGRENALDPARPPFQSFPLNARAMRKEFAELGFLDEEEKKVLGL